MLGKCPNCDVEFTRRVEKVYYCDSCESWFVQVDGEWRVSPEPVTLKDAQPKPEPKPKEKIIPAPSEPVPAEPVKKKPEQGNRQPVRELLGGLITITELEDDDDEDNGD